MNKQEEQAYIQGSRRAWSIMMGECLKHLGYDDPKAEKTKWIIEREAIIAALRGVCANFGDNEWDENLYLPDVIEKHLGRHLHDTMETLASYPCLEAYGPDGRETYSDCQKCPVCRAKRVITRS